MKALQGTGDDMITVAEEAKLSNEKESKAAWLVKLHVKIDKIIKTFPLQLNLL
jgi:hypothetical protein